MNYTLGVDVGGTFTDLFARGDDGSTRAWKVQSSHPEPALAVLKGVDELFRPGERIGRTILGTTAGLNAVLERRGARTALLTTRGFADTYRMARGDRPAIYDLHYRRPSPLVARADIFEVAERVSADGRVLLAIDDAQVDDIVRQIVERAYTSVAVCLLHSYRNEIHEVALGDAIRRGAPGVSVSLSHRVSREWREYERTSTAVVDAYVRPILDAHFQRLRDGLAARGHAPEVLVMRSSGGLMPTTSELIEPATVLMSGPVAGALAAASLASRHGIKQALAIDMGGTSFDVTLIQDGRLPVSDEVAIDGFPLLVASVPIETIGAGGGGVAWLEGGGLRVGPRSAGADPGPVCFGRGGIEPTVTDANAVIGRIAEGTFAGGGLRLMVDEAYAAFDAIATELRVSVPYLCEGVIDIVDAAMVGSLRAMTIERGLDVREFALVAYGGNGPLHAASLAESLGVSRVIVPPSPGTFSASGMHYGEVRKDFSITLFNTESSTTLDAVNRGMESLALEASSFSRAAGIDATAVERIWRASVRYRGQEHTADVALPQPPLSAADVTDVVSSFHSQHADLYGHSHPKTQVEFVHLRLSVFAPCAAPLEHVGVGVRHSSDRRSRQVRWRGVELEMEVCMRAAIGEAVVPGPCIVEDATATTLVPPGWTVTASPIDGSLLLVAPGEE